MLLNGRLPITQRAVSPNGRVGIKFFAHRFKGPNLRPGHSREPPVETVLLRHMRIEQILRGRTATGQSGSPPVVVPWTSSATVWARFLLPSADELRDQIQPRLRPLNRRLY